MTILLGEVVRSFFEDHLKVQRGLRPASVRSYRDVLRLFLTYVARETSGRLSRLSVHDLSFERTLQFLRHLEEERGNHARTRNQRLAALRTFFEYLGLRIPEALDTVQRVAAIPVKRVAPPETHYLEREDVSALLRGLPREGRHATRDRALMMFFYNTGARVQEVADLRTEHLELGAQPRAHLHGKGDKWRCCPLWADTVHQLQLLMAESKLTQNASAPVFCSRPGVPLTRFGIYKIVRRHGTHLDRGGARPMKVGPHLLRHTAAVHLLESGVELNVIRAWMGHVRIETTNRYAEITIRTKEAALRRCDPSSGNPQAPSKAVWKDDEALLSWLNSL